VFEKQTSAGVYSEMLMKPLFAACSFAIICGSTSARAEENLPDAAPVVDPSALSVDGITCSDHMAYPDSAVRRGAQGVSAIEVEVAEDGRLRGLGFVRPGSALRILQAVCRDRPVMAEFR